MLRLVKFNFLNLESTLSQTKISATLETENRWNLHFHVWASYFYKKLLKLNHNPNKGPFFFTGKYSDGVSCKKVLLSRDQSLTQKSMLRRTSPLFNHFTTPPLVDQNLENEEVVKTWQIFSWSKHPLQKSGERSIKSHTGLKPPLKSFCENPLVN